MKQWTRAVLCSLAALAALMGAGCGGGGETETGILQVGNGAALQGLDPHIVTGVPESNVLTALYEGLVRLDPRTGEVLPGVAERWELSEDGRTYTFHLREDAAWSNGDPLTAEDFAFAWRRILTPEMAANYVSMLFVIEHAEAYHAGELDSFDEVGIRVIDPQTLEVTLEHPTPYFLDLHIHYTFFPVHRPSIEAAGGLYDRTSPWTRPGAMITNGPYVLTAWEPAERISVRRNPEYWDAASVTLDGIDYLPIANTQTEERSFRAGDLHMTQSVPLQRIDTYREENPEVLQLKPYFGNYFYRFNVTRPPLDDVRVRRALSLAVDRDLILAILQNGGERVATHFVPPEAPDYTGPELVRHDPEAARTLLAEAGYPNGEGFPQLDILYNTLEAHRTIAEAIQRMWKDTLGVEVGILNQDWKVYISSTQQLQYDISRAGWIGDFLDPMAFLKILRSGDGNNNTGWGSAAYDALLDKAEATVDPAPRARVLQQAETLLLEEAPLMPIYFYSRKFLKRPSVQNFAMSPTGYIAWHTLVLEKEGA